MLNEILNPISSQIGAMKISFNFTSIVEILIIIAFISVFYKKFIYQRQSEKLVKGIFILVAAWFFSIFLIYIGLTILGVFLKSLVTLIALSLIVIFQPEMRRLLGYLGQSGTFTMNFWKHHDKSHYEETVDVIKEVIESVKYLSKTRTGALIVFQKELTTGIYGDVGTQLNADVSTELILTIFHINTPLHDGAMIIKDAKIVSAGVLLPLTEDPKLSWRYGTRHRAAIGMSEVSDAACLVVSEETGDVSISVDGVMKKYEDLVTLKQDLSKILGCEEEPHSEKGLFKKITPEQKNQTVTENNR